MKKYFLTGLMILLPIALTLMVLSFFFHFFSSPFLGLTSSLLSSLNLNWPKPLIVFAARIIVLTLFLAAILFLGILGRLFIFKSLIGAANKLFLKIPFFRGIYHTVQDLADSFLSKDKKAFKYAVKIPFPSEKSFSVGFVSGEVPLECHKHFTEPMEPVFLPASPYPITGFIFFVPKRLIENLDLTREEAVEFIISSGMVTPHRPKNAAPEKK
ncbi:MAG: DUF502 domain-containing protein [Parachlamydiales bacterium]|jgi:uncharacterized membrane protein